MCIIIINYLHGGIEVLWRCFRSQIALISDRSCGGPMLLLHDTSVRE